WPSVMLGCRLCRCRSQVIYFLVTRDHAYTIGEFMSCWGRPIAQRLRVVHWEELVRWRELPPGSYLFTDLERLHGGMRQFACHVAQRLASAGPGFRVVNDPRRVKLRYDLLRSLHAAGINSFRPW